MAAFRFLFLPWFCMFVSTETAHVHELLNSLGVLNSQTRSARGQVPPTILKLFNEAEKRRGFHGCRVPQYGVKGNIVRYLQDQGMMIADLSSACPAITEHHLYFNVSVLENVEELVLAQLEIKFKHKVIPAPRKDIAFTMHIYSITKGTLMGIDPRSGRRLLLSQSVQFPAGTVNFNLTGLAKSWRIPTSNYGLVLTLQATLVDDELHKDCDVELLHQSPVTIPEFEAILAVVSLNRKQCQPRLKRHVHHEFYMPSKICKVRLLYIDFKDVGWQNWIIAPNGYFANYCHGECPFSLAATWNGTNHAVLQTMLNSFNPEVTPQPCCVPIKLSPLSMLYYDNHGNVVLRHFEDMIVDECGCR